jgi:uncharacterized membrane protein
MSEKAYRTAIKTTSWRFFATIDTFIISYLITGSLVMASSIGVIEVFTKLFLYYVHERVWNRISFGRVMKT